MMISQQLLKQQSQNFLENPEELANPLIKIEDSYVLQQKENNRIRELIKEMACLKTQFDQKWCVMLQYIEVIDRKSGENEVGLNKGEQFMKQTDFAAGSLDEEQIDQNFNSNSQFQSLDAGFSIDLRPSIDQQINEGQFSLTLDNQAPSAPSTFSNSSKNTNLLIRDQLISQLEEARTLIQRDELAKVKLIEHMKQMQAEIHTLKKQLMIANAQQSPLTEVNEAIENLSNSQNKIQWVDDMITEDDRSMMVAVNVVEESKSQKEDTKDEMRQDLDESELVHFSVTPGEVREGESPIKQLNKATTDENVVDTSQIDDEYQIVTEEQDEFDEGLGEDLSIREDLVESAAFLSKTSTSFIPQSTNLLDSFTAKLPQKIRRNGGISSIHTDSLFSTDNHYQQSEEAKPKIPRKSPQNHQINKLVSPLSFCGNLAIENNYASVGSQSKASFLRPLTERHSRNNTILGVPPLSEQSNALLQQLRNKLALQSPPIYNQSGTAAASSYNSTIASHQKPTTNGFINDLSAKLMAKYMTNSNPVVQRVTEVEEQACDAGSSGHGKKSQMQVNKSPTKIEKENYNKETTIITNNGGSSYFQNRKVKKQISAKKNNLVTYRQQQKTIQVLASSASKTSYLVNGGLSPNKKRIRPTMTNHFFASPRTFGLNNM